MSTQRDTFTSNLFLYTTERGFCLQTAKRLHIASQFKIKSRNNEARNTSHLPINFSQPGQILSNIEEQREERRKKIVDKIRSSKKITQFVNQIPQQQNKQEQMKMIATSGSKAIDPQFPEINKKRIKKIIKYFKTIVEQRQDQNSLQGHSKSLTIEGEQKSKSKKLKSKIIKFDNQFQKLIEKQVKKTQNERTLGHGRLQFDIGTSQNNEQSKKKHSFNKIKKLHRSILAEKQEPDQKSTQSQYQVILQGPTVQNFNPNRTKLTKTALGKQKKQWCRYSPPRPTVIQKHSNKTERQFIQEVIGWDHEQGELATENLDSVLDRTHFQNQFKSQRFI